MAIEQVTQKWLDAVMVAFVEDVEVDDLEGVGRTVREGEVNALLATVEDPDPTDVADAIWESIPNGHGNLDDDYLVTLLDVVDLQWDARAVA